jgi:hypothetical protein
LVLIATVWCGAHSGQRLLQSTSDMETMMKPLITMTAVISRHAHKRKKRSTHKQLCFTYVFGLSTQPCPPPTPPALTISTIAQHLLTISNKPTHSNNNNNNNNNNKHHQKTHFEPHHQHQQQYNHNHTFVHIFVPPCTRNSALYKVICNNTDIKQQRKQHQQHQPYSSSSSSSSSLLLSLQEMDMPRTLLRCHKKALHLDHNRCTNMQSSPDRIAQIEEEIDNASSSVQERFCRNKFQCWYSKKNDLEKL